MGGQHHAMAAVPIRKTWCTFYRRMVGLWYRFGRQGRSRPTWIRSPDLPARKQPLYRLRYPCRLRFMYHINYIRYCKYLQVLNFSQLCFDSERYAHSKTLILFMSKCIVLPQRRNSTNDNQLEFTSNLVFYISRLAEYVWSTHKLTRWERHHGYFNIRYCNNVCYFPSGCNTTMAWQPYEIVTCFHFWNLS